MVRFLSVVLFLVHATAVPALATLSGLPLVLDADRNMTALRLADDPGVAAAVASFNAHNPVQAETLFQVVTDKEIQLAGIAYSIGNLYYEENESDCQRAGSALIELADSYPGHSDYQTLGSHVSDFTLLRATVSPDGEAAADAVLQMDEDHNPFYDKARFYKARYLRAHAQERGTSQSVPNQIFQELKALYPQQPSLRELTGEQILWGQELIDDSGAAPAWARYIRELYARQAAVLHWWFTERQLPNGELGGGFGDDVELLRDWGPFAVISNGDPSILAGIERLSNGVWDTLLSQNGFDRLSDVEHSSEPSADTIPTMMILKWGDPVWIERDMRSARQIRDVYMGIDDNGYYRFRSAWFGDTRTGSIQQGGDNAMCTRPMKHFQHLALWGNPEAERVYLNWIAGWFTRTKEQLDDKPAYIVPRSIFFPTGNITSQYCATWYGNCHYFSGGPEMAPYILGSFLNAYLYNNNREYLEPFQRYLHWESYGPLIPDDDPGTPGSAHWVIYCQQHTGNFDHLAQYRWISGDRTSDEYVLRFARPTQRYYVDNDLDTYIAAIEAKAKALRYNFRLKTLEQIQTDRAALDGAMEVFGTYTGGLFNWRESLIPSMAVTWEATDTDFAALVTTAQEDHVRAWVYSFHDEPIDLGMRFWRLISGNYGCSEGEILPGEQTNLRYAWKPDSPYDAYRVFKYRRPLDTWHVTIPPRTPYAIDVRLLETVSVPEYLPDAAISDSDLTKQGDSLTATVHSIGGVAIDQLTCELQARWGQTWESLRTVTAENIPAPKLEPSTTQIHFDFLPSADAYRVILDPNGVLTEKAESNNTGTLDFAVKPANLLVR